MGLRSCMAALIFFVGAAHMNPLAACAAEGLPVPSPDVPEQAERLPGAGSLLGFHEMMFLQEVAVERKRSKAKGYLTAGRAFFVGNTRLNAADAFSEVFGYSETETFRMSSRAFSREYGNEHCTGTTREISKSELLSTLKEGMHNVLRIDPRYNPFLWRHLLRASLGDYTFGLDARIGSTMYVSPKVTWSQNLAGWSLTTELKWVPVLKTTAANNKGSYVLFKLGVKF